MRTYLLLLICSILQFLHAGWLFLHSFSFAPDCAFSQVASPWEAICILGNYERLFLISASFTALFAALSFILLAICMLIRRHHQAQRLARRVYQVCQGGIGFTGLLLASIMLYSTLQELPAELAPIAPWENSFWAEQLNQLQYAGIINGGLLLVMATTCIVLCSLRFTAHQQAKQCSLHQQ